ncbi:Hint domain-containing protein [Thioclava sp. FR2]|uniref:Hint domain-containing protein n=1 Tax=Thioclava sp. FR2 TaxID=3445780 RepID=UPI003EB914B1
MPTTEVYLRGDQVATYSSVRTSGNSNGVKVTLGEVDPLGSATTYFRVVISYPDGTEPTFSSAYSISIYAWPDPDPPEPPIYSEIIPNPNMFQGRATSGGHLIFSSPKLVIQLAPIEPGTLQIGPGINPTRYDPLFATSFPPTPPAIPCFAAGTLVQTDRGPCPVELIAPGDRLQTADNGFQEVVWAGKRKVCGLGSMAPVRIEANVLGNRRRLLVSPQHRMLCRGWNTQLITGETEVFAAAVHLVNGRTIRRVRRPMITYVHLLCEHHEVILAEGALTESLFPGGMAMSAFGRQAREEIRAIFPTLSADHGTGRGIARTTVTRDFARVITA